MCRSVLDIGSIGLARWVPDASVATGVDVVHAAGTTIATATTIARALAGLHDPEDPDSVDRRTAGLGRARRAQRAPWRRPDR